MSQAPDKQELPTHFVVVIVAVNVVFCFILVLVVVFCVSRRYQLKSEDVQVEMIANINGTDKEEQNNVITEPAEDPCDEEEGLELSRMPSALSEELYISDESIDIVTPETETTKGNGNVSGVLGTDNGEC